MRVQKLGLMVLIGVGVCGSISPAATIYLKNGRTLEGVIKYSEGKVVQLDVGGGVITLNKGKIARIEEGHGGEVGLSEKSLRKVIITRKKAPKHLLPHVYRYNDLRAQYAAITRYNDEAKVIRADRPKLMKRVEVYKAKIRELDGALRPGKDALGVSRYNELVLKQNATHADVRACQAKIQWGRQRLPLLRGKINAYRNTLIDFLSEVSVMQAGVIDPEPNEALFVDELQVRIAKLIDQVSGRYVHFDKKHGPHTVVEVQINGRLTLPMLIDTGASTVTLSMAKAKALGLTFDKRNAVDMRIANGEVVKGYYTLLASVSVSGLEAQQVIATIMDKPPSEDFEGLLGMTFLENFELSLNPQTGVMEIRETNF